MARAKVVSSKPRAPKEEDVLKQPDEVLSTLQKYSDHLSLNYRRYVAGLGLMIVMVLIATWGISRWRASTVSKSRAFEKSVASVYAPVQANADDESLGGPASLDPAAKDKDKDKKVKAEFATAAERDKAALDALKKTEGDVSGELKWLLVAAQGRVGLSMKDAELATSASQKFLDEKKDSSFALIVTENRGRAAEAAGKLEEAASYYAKLAEQTDLYFKVHGNMLLGDLYNPTAVAAGAKADGKDGTKARSYYDEALKALTPAEGQVFSAELRGLRAEIKRRVDLIQG